MRLEAGGGRKTQKRTNNCKMIVFTQRRNIFPPLPSTSLSCSFFFFGKFDNACEIKAMAGFIYLIRNILLLLGLGSGLRSSPLLGNTSRSSLAVRGSDSEINVLLGIDTDIEGRDVDELLANPNVPLLDEHAGMVDGLSEALLEDLGLQPPLKELLGGKLKDEVELHLVLSEEPKATHPTKQSLSLEDTLGVLGVKGEKGTGSLTKLGKGKLNPPDLPLAPKSVFSDELELSIKTLLLVSPPGGLGGLPVVTVHGVGRHGESG